MLNAQFFTDTGQHREKNEDAGGIFYNQTHQQLLVLCDGMGGHKAGEVASQFVTNQLRDYFETENFIELDQAESWLSKTLKDINLELFEYATTNEEYRGMGTTCVCALIFDNKIVVANIGDSRAYVINSREIEQITYDHSFVNHLLMTGQITEEEAFNHPQRNIITKVMGTDRRVSPDIFTKRISYYNYILLNSDGLSDYVRNHEIETLMNQSTSLNELGEALIQAALDHQSKDNVSVLLAEIEGNNV